MTKRLHGHITELSEAVVLVTPRSFGVEDPELRRELESVVGEVRYNRRGRPLRADELCAEIADVDGMIAGLDEIDASVFAGAPRLRVVARYGVGASNVDLDAAISHGVVVTNTPGVNATAVAELTIGLIFALARSIPQANVAAHADRWSLLRGIEVGGKTVGILGLGKIGTEVATRLVALGCSVLAYDPYADARVAENPGVHLVSFDEVIAQADFLTLHLPLTEETRGIINRESLTGMREGAYLVNTARGELIVEEDLLWALTGGHLRGAALDALSEEPPPPDHPFLAREDIILTPHIGAHSAEAVNAMGRVALADLLAVLSGGAPRFPVTPLRAMQP